MKGTSNPISQMRKEWLKENKQFATVLELRVTAGICSWVGCEVECQIFPLCHKDSISLKKSQKAYKNTKMD